MKISINSILAIILTMVCFLSFTAAGVDLGAVWNDDGDMAITSEDPEKAGEMIRFLIDGCSGTGIKTITYSIGAGSEILLYPTKVGNNWGWRKTKYDEDPRWQARINRGRALAAKNFDAVRVAGEQSRKNGMYFFPSCRINDSHFIFDPQEYPLTGKFWLDNPDCRIGVSPSGQVKEYANLLDYSNEKVRRYRLDIISEVIDRYKDIMTGIELDFTRSFFLFSNDKAKESAHLVTQMVAEVRSKLDAAGGQMLLIVRVPSTMRNCEKLGYEIEEWMKQKLVDVVVPAQLMTTAFEMPLDEFCTLAKKYECKVYAGLYPRVGWEFPFYESPKEYAVSPDRQITPQLARAAYSNYWAMGADGMYLFNFKVPKNGAGTPVDEYYRILKDSACKPALVAADRVYAVTKAYYLDFEDTYTYPKQIPCEIKTGEVKEFYIYVGENFENDKSMFLPKYIGLRVGFAGMAGDEVLKVRLNGEVLKAAENTIVKTNSPTNITRLTPKAANAFAQYRIEDVKTLKQGFNTVAVEIKNDKDPAVMVTDVNIGVLYENDLNKILVN